MIPDQPYVEGLPHAPAARGLGSDWWDTLGARLHSLFANRVPVGYEDETGFHFGSKSPFCETPVVRLAESAEAVRS